MESCTWARMKVMIITILAFGGLPLEFGASASYTNRQSAFSASAWSGFPPSGASLIPGVAAPRDRLPISVLPLIARHSVAEQKTPSDGIWPRIDMMDALQNNRPLAMHTGASSSGGWSHGAPAATSYGPSRPVALQTGTHRGIPGELSRTNETLLAGEALPDVLDVHLLHPQGGHGAKIVVPVMLPIVPSFQRAGKNQYTLASVGLSPDEDEAVSLLQGLDVSEETFRNVQPLTSLRTKTLHQELSNASGGISFNDFDTKKFLADVKELVDGDAALSKAMKKAATMADEEIRNYCELRDLKCTTMREFARDLPEIVEEWPFSKIVESFLSHVEQIEALASHTTMTGLRPQTDSDSHGGQMAMHAGQLQEAGYPLQVVSAVISPVTTFLWALEEDLKGSLDSLDTALALGATDATLPWSPAHFDAMSDNARTDECIMTEKATPAMLAKCKTFVLEIPISPCGRDELPRDNEDNGGPPSSVLLWGFELSCRSHLACAQNLDQQRPDLLDGVYKLVELGPGAAPVYVKDFPDGSGWTVGDRRVERLYLTHSLPGSRGTTDESSWAAIVPNDPHIEDLNGKPYPFAYIATDDLPSSSHVAVGSDGSTESNGGVLQRYNLPSQLMRWRLVPSGLPDQGIRFFPALVKAVLCTMFADPPDLLR
ncbi:hypothetical protein BESB_082600 [Besnoitia besnoiti]|uniref:Uncharacterized protein n=1 Tax=Besnoitia besnoiti TaxID=94643 RepID=A0A2A9M9R6_BESBE|nr:hypothetical protein BESB_082600 [Besnoitia besnoiti]PFH33061.1 hypothetical protein BESB_082600 [Besnoitia besnoiti]